MTNPKSKISETQQKNSSRGPYDKIVAVESHQFYNPIYTKVTGSISAGLLLSKIMYHPTGDIHEGIYYTDTVLCKELGMGVHQLRDAKKRLINLHIAAVKRKGLPAKTEYKIDTNRLVELVEQSVLKSK